MIQGVLITSIARPSFASAFSLTGTATSNKFSFHHANVSSYVGEQFEASNGYHYLRINMAVKKIVHVKKASANHQYNLVALLDQDTNSGHQCGQYCL